MGIWSTILGFGAGYVLGANKDKESIRRMRSDVMARFSTGSPWAEALPRRWSMSDRFVR